jgi:hypothetical protein
MFIKINEDRIHKDEIRLYVPQEHKFVNSCSIVFILKNNDRLDEEYDDTELRDKRIAELDGLLVGELK